MSDFSKFRRKSLIITGLGTFMATLDASIVNVSLPTISRDLTTSIEMVGWVILSYGIAVFSLLMIFGALAEKKGFQFSYRYGFSIFLIGSALCGLSSGIIMLIVARVIQGIGAALLISVGPALITRSFPAKERGRGLSLIAMVVSVGLMLGPPLGGFIIALSGWRWIFFVNLPVCLIGLYLTSRYIGHFPISDPNKKISLPGSASLSLGLLSLMALILILSRQPDTPIYAIGIGLISCLLFGLFFYFESKPATRMIGLDIFKNRLFTMSGSAMLLVFIPLISMMVLLPFYLEEIKNLRPEQVGLFLMVVPICGFVFAPLAGYLADKMQARIIATLGIILMAVGFWLVGIFQIHTTTIEIIIALLFVGIGMAIFATPNTSCLMGAAREKQLGSAGGILATIRTLGISVGTGLSVAIFSYYRGQMTTTTGDNTGSFLYGFQSVYDIMLIIISVALVFSLLRGQNRLGLGGHGS